MAHYKENTANKTPKKTFKNRIWQILLVFAGFCVLGYFISGNKISGSSVPELTKNPRSKYVSEGLYTLSGEWTRFRLDPKYKFDYSSQDNLECTDANGNIFYIGPDAGIKSVSASGGYDLSEIYCRTVNGANGSIEFTNFRR